MGTVHSSESEGSKLSLADRRYRVSQARAAAVVKRRSTRKLGSVALELKNPNDESEAGTSLQFYQNDDGDGDSGSEEGEGKEKGESKEETNPTGNEEESGARKISKQLRQRRLGNFQLTRTENAANATILLTRTQRVLIENCWKRAKKGAAEGGIGARVFHTVLIAQPDIKLLFGLEKVPQGRLKYEGQFRRHAGLLNRALEYIVKNLQYTEKLGHHFQTLGKKHCQMNGGRAFPSHYWDAFLECITQSVLECDGASGGRQHRCRETAMAWRNLISFIVQQMRRGFEDERLLRKRFSASLMGIRGVANNALNAAYNSSGSERTKRAATGRPRPSIVHQHHSHGSLGSLEMLPNQQYSLPISTLSSSSAAAFGVRARASSAISPLALGQQSSKGSIGPTGQESCEEEQFCHLMLHSDASPSNSSSARSASWCAEVSEGQLRRLQIGDDNKQSRTARSDLNIDNEGGGDVFYTPRMPPRNVEINSPTVECTAIDDDDIPPPKPAMAAVQLLLNAASSEGHMLDVRSAPPGILLSRHSFSEFAVNGGGNEGGERMGERMPKECMEKAAAINASQKLLSLAHAHMHSGGKESGDSSPTQQRRLSAL